MKLFGIQETINLSNIISSSDTSHTIESNPEIKEVLDKFQLGYSSRDINQVESFVNDLFVSDKELPIVLGTSFNELFIGTKEIMKLIEDDWNYWGDVKLDLKNSYISFSDDITWVIVAGNVKRSFESSIEKDRRYFSMVNDTLNNTTLSIKEKLANIDWTLSLSHHEHHASIRDNCMPLYLSGVLIKKTGSWKFIHMQFSMTKPNFPDTRFEFSHELSEEYQKDIQKIHSYQYNHLSNNQMQFLNHWITSLNQNNNQSKYYKKDSLIIGLNNQSYQGYKNINSYIDLTKYLKYNINLENGIYHSYQDSTHILLIGSIEYQLSNEELLYNIEYEINSISNSNITDTEKLFKIHRSIAYMQKEATYGENYSYPFRITAVINQTNSTPTIGYAHFSFPYYWIIEGKYNDFTF